MIDVQCRELQAWPHLPAVQPGATAARKLAPAQAAQVPAEVAPEDQQPSEGQSQDRADLRC